jgi:hypothetical protein
MLSDCTHCRLHACCHLRSSERHSIQIVKNSVCRFLEVDSWNDQHGFEVGDGVEEKLVEEMKAAHAEGEARRARIKGDFGDEESRLSNMGRDVEKLKEKLDVLAQEAGASPDLEALEVST